ncbi:MAG: hydratase [Solobacterium sp.]|nr:hydratase [Solobacterium sp.]
MKLIETPVVIRDGKPVSFTGDPAEGREKTLTYQILNAHNVREDTDRFHIRFDSLTSHDITYVGIIQTARASGMETFPMPYVLTNCHNTLCAVGGTINEDDHQFALSAAKKYGGIFVPPCYGVIHSYNREMMSGCGRMILGSDSHTRYGALGTMGVGEGGGELAKQLVGRTYDLKKPETVLVWLTGKVRKGVGPHDVALALVGAVYASGFVKNRSLEFAGEGITALSQDFRNGIDVMTTETTCWSSIWETDETTRAYFERHGRPEAYAKLSVQEGAVYDRMIEIDLSAVECMIALPMHPSFALPIRELKSDPYRYLKEAEDRANRQLSGNAVMDLVSKIDADGNIHADQGIIAGCSGGVYENICATADILKNGGRNGSFRLSVYPDSMPAYRALSANGVLTELISDGAVFREAFCGPCFGAGETPANGELSLRHTTRNFPNREGSKPGEGQIAAVALMDARSIAATALNGGILTAADEISYEEVIPEETFDASIYSRAVVNAYGNADSEAELRFGPNIKDWPEMPSLSEDILIRVVSHIEDDVTTTDELIPSGETSSYRSNPLRLAEFTLSRRDPGYVDAAKETAKISLSDHESIPADLKKVLTLLAARGISVSEDTNVCSAVYARRPGDGSAREQAASCQRVLGGGANFANEYATKRYRSNCINWGILPFLSDEEEKLQKDTWVFVRNIRDSLLNEADIEAYAVTSDSVQPLAVSLGSLGREEKDILASGSLINYYKNH